MNKAVRKAGGILPDLAVWAGVILMLSGYDTSGIILTVAGLYSLSWLENHLLKKMIADNRKLNDNSFQIRLWIDIEAVLGHELTESYYRHLSKYARTGKQVMAISIAPDDSFESWKGRLLKNFRKMHGQTGEESLLHLRFNIINGLLFCNDIPVATKKIHHDILIPYDSSEDRDLLSPWNALLIRIVLVNGFLNLQIGDYTKDMAPPLTEAGSFRFKARETLCAFPLIYLQEDMPPDILNLTMVYKENDAENLPNWKHAADEMDEYRKIYMQKALTDFVDGDEIRAWLRRQDEKGGPVLKENGFSKVQNYDHYSSKLMDVALENVKEQTEGSSQGMFSEYEEEKVA